MFTGIVESTAKIISQQVEKGTKFFTIGLPHQFSDIKIGSSIACDGICLTVLDFNTTCFTVQVMNETLQKSTAESWSIGRLINLERGLKLGDRLDGHWVLGHVDATSRFIRKESRGNTDYYHFDLRATDRKYLIPQGSITINGISLTIASLTSKEFSVALIKHTLENTNLIRIGSGEKVNIEYDVLGKYLLQKA